MDRFFEKQRRRHSNGDDDDDDDDDCLYLLDLRMEHLKTDAVEKKRGQSLTALHN
jgi:hypothetical protein